VRVGRAVLAPRTLLERGQRSRASWVSGVHHPSRLEAGQHALDIRLEAEVDGLWGGQGGELEPGETLPALFCNACACTLCVWCLSPPCPLSPFVFAPPTLLFTPCFGQTMTSVGTPIYVAPEVMQGYAYNAKCDSFSFGICLVAMVRAEKDILEFYFEALRKAMQRKTKQGVGITILNSRMYNKGWRPLLPLEFTRPYPRLAALIRKCWSNDAGERPTFDEIVKQLGDIGDEVRGNEEPEVQFLSRVPDEEYHERMELDGEEVDEEFAATAKFVSRAEHDRIVAELRESLRLAELAAVK